MAKIDNLIPFPAPIPPSAPAVDSLAAAFDKMMAAREHTDKLIKRWLDSQER